MGMLKKFVKSQDKRQSGAGDLLPAGLGLYQALYEFLYRTCWDEDGSARETGTVLLFVSEGRLKAMLNDRDGSVVKFLTFEGSKTICEALEAGLLNDDIEWKAAKKYGGKK